MQSAYFSQHGVRVAHVFGAAALAEVNVPCGMVVEGSESDDDVVEARGIESHSACGTEVEGMESESMATVMATDDDLWMGVEANAEPLVEGSDDADFYSFDLHPDDTVLCSPCQASPAPGQELVEEASSLFSVTPHLPFPS